VAPEEYSAALSALRRETAEAGRDAGAVEAGVVVFARVGDDEIAPAEGALVQNAVLRRRHGYDARHLFGLCGAA